MRGLAGLMAHACTAWHAHGKWYMRTMHMQLGPDAAIAHTARTAPACLHAYGVLGQLNSRFYGNQLSVAEEVHTAIAERARSRSRYWPGVMDSVRVVASLHGGAPIMQRVLICMRMQLYRYVRAYVRACSWCSMHRSNRDPSPYCMRCACMCMHAVHDVYVGALSTRYSCIRPAG